MVNTKATLTLAPFDKHGNEIPIGSKELSEYKLTVT